MDAWSSRARRGVLKFNLESVLAPFRGLEQNTDAVVVLGDEQAMRVLVAWQKIDNEWSPPATRVPVVTAGGMGRLWKWIVAGWDVLKIEREVARLAGVPRHIAHEKLEMLVGNRLIYPDGSMAGGARSALAIHTAKKLGIKQQPAAKPAAVKPNDDLGN